MARRGDGHLPARREGGVMAARARKGFDREKIVAATVRFRQRGGQGVIVPGNMIVTAAHVLHEWSSTGGMTLGDSSFEDVTTRDGRTIAAMVLAVEPVADIAVLGAPDNQMRPEQADAFEAAVEPVAPGLICTADYPLFAPVPVHLFTHTDRWVTARAMQCRCQCAEPGLHGQRRSLQRHVGRPGRHR
jgi:hypothetical protein